LHLLGEKTPTCLAAFTARGKTCEDTWFMKYNCICTGFVCECSTEYVVQFRSDRLMRMVKVYTPHLVLRAQ